MRTDADDPARVRDPTIELMLSHTATLTDQWLQPPAANRQRPRWSPVRSRRSGARARRAQRGVDAPAVGYALEFVFAAVDERKARARDEVAHGARDEHLAGTSQGGDTRADVRGDTTDIVATQFDLTGMQSDAYLESEFGCGACDRKPTRHGPGRAIETRERAVACGFHQDAPMTVDLSSDESVVAIEQLFPLGVAECGGSRGRVDNVRVEH